MGNCPAVRSPKCASTHRIVLTEQDKLKKEHQVAVKMKKQSVGVACLAVAAATGPFAGAGVALVHNLALFQFEAYSSGRLVGYLRYSMRGSELWLLYLHLAKDGDGADVPHGLIRQVLDEAARRRIAVHPYCLEVRSFMRENPGYLSLVPNEWRGRFRLPAGTAAIAAPRSRA